MPCSGRVDILHLLKAFEDGADGVYVAGCMEGECHYLTGNYKAKRKVKYVKEILAALGLEPERIEMFNMSSSEGPPVRPGGYGVHRNHPRPGPQPRARGQGGLGAF